MKYSSIAQVALVDLGHERQLVHVLEHRAVLVVHDLAGRVALGNAVDRGEVAALGDFLDGEVEFVARRRSRSARGLARLSVRLHRHLGADEADLQRRVGLLQRLRPPCTSEANDGVEVWMTHSS